MIDGATLNDLLNGVELTHPISVEDVQALRAALGDSPELEVFHRIREVVVRVRVGAAIRYERSLTVTGAPPVVGKVLR